MKATNFLQLICLCIIIPFSFLSCSSDSDDNNASIELLIGGWNSVSFHYLEKTSGIISHEDTEQDEDLGIVFTQNNRYKTYERYNGKWHEDKEGVWKYMDGYIYTYDDDTKIEEKIAVLKLTSSSLILEFKENRIINGTEIEYITTGTYIKNNNFTDDNNNEDSDSEAGYDAAGYLRVSSSYYGLQLKDLAGNIYIPTTASVAALKQQGVDLNSTDYDLVYVYLKWVEETTTKAGTSRQVELVAASPVSKGKEAGHVTSMEDLTTSKEAPVVTLEPMGAYGSTAKPWLYGSELLVLPIQWKMKNDKEMLKQHTFSLYYISGNQEDQDDKTMTFYLLHDKGTDNAEKNSLVDAANNFSFDIEPYMENYKAQNGAYPNRVVVKTKAALDGFTLPTPGEDGTGKVWTDYEIDASFLNSMQK